MPKSDELVLRGSGPRIRVYCLYDDDAIAGEDANEGKLPEVPTEGDWRLSIPVTEEDYEWSSRDIKACAPYITVRKAGEELSDDSEGSGANAAVRINIDRFLQS
ncbi:MAG: hypothetical protein JSS11_06870 [Verrucomicrobia bacterium]|nr:hypothetical protein [Verrucomicrobiota bacterium]